VTNQHANVLTVLDPDPDSDGDGSDAAVVGTILLANGSAGAGATDGTGGQGIKPLPMTHDGWIQATTALSGTGELADEVEGWLARLTEEQNNPNHDVPRVHLDVDPLVPGQAATFALTGAQPGETVFFLSSFGGVGLGPCVPSLGGLCIDLLPPVRRFRSLVTNANGAASFSIDVSPGVPPLTVGFQAIVPRGPLGADSVKTNAVTRATF
jgi:hypothetical protein